MPQLLEVTGFSMGLNYGTEKVRFPAPVPVGAKLRASLTVDEVTDIPGGVQFLVTFTIVSDRGDKPACVAILVLRNYERHSAGTRTHRRGRMDVYMTGRHNATARP